MKKTFKKAFLVLLPLFLLLSIFILTRSASAQVPLAVCQNTASDVVLVIDRSGSMKDQIGTSGTKLSNAKSAAKRFVDILATDTRNRVGLSSFSTEGTIDRTLTNNYASVKTEITALTAGGDTCTECGIFKGNRNVTDNGRAGIKKVVILLTDGRANVIQGSHAVVGQTQAENKALAEAKKSHDNDGTVFFTIGLGNDINASFLKELASSTGGKYYASPTSTELNSIYDKISQIIAKGAISGVIFNDTNNNGALDTNESNLSGWSVLLVKPGNTTSSLNTDSNGAYSFGGLCDGSYTVKQTVKSGWQQTFPSGNNYHTLSLSNGNSQINKNFGNSQIPPTSGPACVENPETITVTPDNGNGIGKPGDEVVYTVTVKNNNTNCADATFNLSATILNNTNQGWTYRFDQTSLTIASGQSGETKLYVTSPVNALDGPKTITVTVTKPGGAQHNVNTIYNVEAPKPTPTLTPTNSPTPTENPTPTPTEALTPTPSPSPELTTLNMFAGLDGIGYTQRIPIGGNKNPLNNTRFITAQIYNASNNQRYNDQAIGTSFTYNPISSRFEGSFTLDENFGSGIYNIYIKSPQSLYARLSGSVNLIKGGVNTIPIIEMITGNINDTDLSENTIDIMDYNVLMSCSIYSQDTSTCEQDPNYASYSDLNDDGRVDEDDYTLFLKEFSNQQGAVLP